MSESAYTTHPLHASLEAILTQQENPNFFETVISESEQYSYYRDHVFAVTKLIKALLAQTPAVAVSLGALSTINANLQAVITEINNFVSNKAAGHLTNASNYIDQNVIPLLVAFPPKAGKSIETASTIADIRDASRKSIAALSKQSSELAEQLAVLSKKVVEQQTLLANATEAIATQKAEALAVTAQVNQKYAEQEAERTSGFNLALDGFNKKFTEQDELAEKNITELIQSIESSRDKAALILQVVGNIGVTGNYQRIAEVEGAKADMWRWITVGLFGVGIILAVCTFFKFWNQPITPEIALSAFIRLLYAIIITTPAWYAAKESARHRSKADTARQTELELASLGPFIELMDEDKKSSIREELIKTYFGNGISAHEVSEPASTKDIKELAIEALRAIGK